MHPGQQALIPPPVVPIFSVPPQIQSPGLQGGDGGNSEQSWGKDDSMGENEEEEKMEISDEDWWLQQLAEIRRNFDSLGEAFLALDRKFYDHGVFMEQQMNEMWEMLENRVGQQEIQCTAFFQQKMEEMQKQLEFSVLQVQQVGANSER
jgi:hypothetical protein